MKTYVINMEKDVFKRRAMEKQLVIHKELEYIIWTGIEGKKLTKQNIDGSVLPEFFDRYGRIATLPAIGCSLSHLSIYKDMLDENIDNALILEDDAILSDNLLIQAFRPWLEKDSPIVILLTPDFWFKKKGLVAKLGNSSHSLYKFESGYMASGYLLNKKAAKLLYDINFPVRYVADDWNVFMNKGLNIFGIVPHVISYPDGCGEIGLSQHIHKTLYDKFRAFAVSIYIKILYANCYLHGNRYSNKKWK